METPSSLYSRIRPGKITCTRIRGFLALPAELRNQVYLCYFEPEVRCEISSKTSPMIDSMRHQSIRLLLNHNLSNTQVRKYRDRSKAERPRTIRISRQLGKYDIVQSLKTDWATSLFALTLACKQVYSETRVFVYCSTRFVFDAPKRISNFLRIISTPQLQLITKLELHYTPYNHPSFGTDIWQEKHTKSWTRACAAISKKLIGICELKILLEISEQTPQFNLRVDWLKPLLQFRRLTSPQTVKNDIMRPATLPSSQRKLSKVRVELRSRLSHNFNGNVDLVKADEHLHQLFSHAISLAILGATEEQAMKEFKHAWEVTYHRWQMHLGYSRIEW